MKKLSIFIIFCVFFAGCLVSCAPSSSSPDVTITETDGFDEENAVSSYPSEDETPHVLKTEEQEETLPMEKPIAQTPEYAVYLSSKTDGLNVRSGAGVKYSVLGTLDKGDMVKYVGEKEGWAETVYLGKKAYVYSKYVEKVSIKKRSDDVESVINIGCELLGAQYVYGATRLHDGKGNFYRTFSPAAFDCSSLMQYVFYYGKGVFIDVNTRTQVKQGVEVDKKDIRRGDLMFFTNSSRKNKTGIERIGHVALYLGDNYILHTASDHAVIEKISPTRWSYYICARRI